VHIPRIYIPFFYPSIKFFGHMPFDPRQLCCRDADQPFTGSLPRASVDIEIRLAGMGIILVKVILTRGPMVNSPLWLACMDGEDV
jgi:hypothetical protein